MKRLLAILMLVPGLLLSSEGDPTAVTLRAGEQTVSAKLPDSVVAIIRSPDAQPTFIQGTQGNEGTTIGRSEQFDLYKLRLFDEATLKLHEHPDPYASSTNLDTFIANELNYYKKTFDVVERDKWIPESLKATNSEKERYVLLTGTFKGHKNPKAKFFLWRVMLVGGHIVMAEREIGGGIVDENNKKISPKNEQEWAFLQSVTVH